MSESAAKMGGGRGDAKEGVAARSMTTEEGCEVASGVGLMVQIRSMENKYAPGLGMPFEEWMISQSKRWDRTGICTLEGGWMLNACWERFVVVVVVVFGGGVEWPVDAGWWRSVRSVKTRGD